MTRIPFWIRAVAAMFVGLAAGAVAALIQVRLYWP